MSKIKETGPKRVTCPVSCVKTQWGWKRSWDISTRSILLKTQPLTMLVGSELDPICKSGQQCLLLIWQLDCYGTEDINVLLPLVWCIILGLFCTFFLICLLFFLILILEIKLGFSSCSNTLSGTSSTDQLELHVFVIPNTKTLKNTVWDRKIRCILAKFIHGGFES